MAKVKMRKEVQAFAEEMEKALQANEHKGGWQKMSFEDLIARLREETDELDDCTVYKLGKLKVEKVRREAADVGNFAMFIADNATRPLPTDEEE